MTKKLKSLEYHNAESYDFYSTINSNEPQLNGIACPNCGKELYDSSPMTTLTSNPPQKNIACYNKGCGYTGYRIA
jgi:C4-type Zn-finger protein